MILERIIDHLITDLDLLICGDVLDPPLLLKYPLHEIIYLSCCILRYLLKLEYFNCNKLSCYFLLFINSSIPCLFFFCNALNSLSCLCFNLFIPVYILNARAFIHDYFYYFYKYIQRYFTFCAST
jgi:hypothetical protein